MSKIETIYSYQMNIHQLDEIIDVSQITKIIGIEKYIHSDIIIIIDLVAAKFRVFKHRDEKVRRIYPIEKLSDFTNPAKWADFEEFYNKEII